MDSALVFGVLCGAVVAVLTWLYWRRYMRSNDPPTVRGVVILGGCAVSCAFWVLALMHHFVLGASYRMAHSILPFGVGLTCVGALSLLTAVVLIAIPRR